MNNKKGVAGLEVLLGVVASIFIIGVMIMAFALAGAELEESTWDVTTGTITNETIASVDDAGEDLAVAAFRDVSCTISSITNTTDGVDINSSQYTETDCNIVNATTTFGGFDWNVSYSYTYLADTTESLVMNDTANYIADVADWFPTFIVITAIVVLIILITLIYRQVRGSGVMGGA